MIPGLHEAMELARRTGYVLIATADVAGTPHLAAAGRIEAAQDDLFIVSAWFCPGTVDNLRGNRRVALVVWEPRHDHGLQLIGQVESIEEFSVLDGYAPEVEPGPPIPQVERILRIRVDKVLDFRLGPHSDLPVTVGGGECGVGERSKY